MIAAVVPDGVAVADLTGELPADAALPAEAAAAELHRAVPRRRREFGAGRLCARQALAILGAPVVPVLPGARREPVWPAGVVGSITHRRTYCAAAVARRARWLSIGIDAELPGPLSDDARRLVLRPEERAWVRDRAGDGTSWDRVIFSAKESLYKAWYPLAGRWLGFDDATIQPGPGGTLTVRLHVPAPVVDGRAVTGFTGWYGLGEHLLCTAVTVPAPVEETP